MTLRGVMTPAMVGVMTPTKARKVHTCICGRTFTTSSGAKHHYVKCPQEQARSAAYVAWLEAGCPS